MAVLQIVSDLPGAGKTSLAGALLLHLSSGNHSVAYYKPLSQAGPEDPDVSFISDRLLPHGTVPQPPAPQSAPPTAAQGDGLPASLVEEIRAQTAQLERQADAVLLEGPDLIDSENQPSPIPSALAAALEHQVLLILHYSKELTGSSVQQFCSPFGERLAGVILNKVPSVRRMQLEDGLAAELKGLGLPFLGAVAEDRAMLSISVAQIADYLKGSWVQEPEGTDAPVERFLIGGNIMDASPTYFGRHWNQAVITRGARPDIQMASLTDGTRCLILTGGEEPTEYIKAEALQREVPLLLVNTGTLETAEALGGLLNLPANHTPAKCQRFLVLLRQSLDLDALAGIATG